MPPPNEQLIVCADCGSVRFPVPAIVRQTRLTVVGQPNTAIEPCPVCTMAQIIANAHAAAQAEMEQSRAETN